MPIGWRGRPWPREREGPTAADRGRDSPEGAYQADGYRVCGAREMPDQVGHDEKTTGKTGRSLEMAAKCYIFAENDFQ